MELIKLHTLFIQSKSVKTFTINDSLVDIRLLKFFGCPNPGNGFLFHQSRSNSVRHASKIDYLTFLGISLFSALLRRRKS